MEFVAREVDGLELFVGYLHALRIKQGWRVMGALEAADGMLLFGMSTAFIFAVMQTYWPILAPPVSSR